MLSLSLPLLFFLSFLPAQSALALRFASPTPFFLPTRCWRCGMYAITMNETKGGQFARGAQSRGTTEIVGRNHARSHFGAYG